MRRLPSWHLTFTSGTDGVQPRKQALNRHSDGTYKLNVRTIPLPAVFCTLKAFCPSISVRITYWNLLQNQSVATMGKESKEDVNKQNQSENFSDLPAAKKLPKSIQETLDNEEKLWSALYEGQ